LKVIRDQCKFEAMTSKNRIRKNIKSTGSGGASSRAASRALVPCVEVAEFQIKVHPVLVSYFGHCLHKAALQMRYITDQHLQAKGLIAPQLGILVVLQSTGPLSQIELGESIGIDKATMVKLLDGLEALKLVERVAVAGDRRIKNIRMTEKGHTAVEWALSLKQEIEKRFLASLKLADQKTFRRLLRELVNCEPAADSRK
jgi:DNA-binding MarR family transcriptional regulator